MPSSFPDPSAFQNLDDDEELESNSVSSPQTSSRRTRRTQASLSQEEGISSNSTFRKRKTKTSLPETPAISSMRLYEEAMKKEQEKKALKIKNLEKAIESKTAEIQRTQEFLEFRNQSVEDVNALSEMEEFYRQTLQQQNQMLLTLQQEVRTVMSLPVNNSQIPRFQTQQPRYPEQFEPEAVRPQESPATHYLQPQPTIASTSNNSKYLWVAAPVLIFVLVSAFTWVNIKSAPSSPVQSNINNEDIKDYFK